MKNRSFLKPLLIAIAIIFAVPAFAQSTMGENPRYKKKKKEIQAEKIAFMTTQMSLTPDEAEKFWPIYNQYEAEMKELKTKYRTEFKELRKKDPEQLTEKEATQLADAGLSHDQEVLDMKKKYHAKFKKVLSGKKLLRMYQSEKEFRKVLLKRLKNKGRGGHGPSQGKH